MGATIKDYLYGFSVCENTESDPGSRSHTLRDNPVGKRKPTYMKGRVCNGKKEPRVTLTRIRPTSSNPLDSVAVSMLVQVDKAKPSDRLQWREPAAQLSGRRGSTHSPLLLDWVKCASHTPHLTPMSVPPPSTYVCTSRI